MSVESFRRVEEKYLLSEEKYDKFTEETYLLSQANKANK